MNRLTQNINGIYSFPVCFNTACTTEAFDCKKCGFTNAVCETLGMYEDLKRTPTEIEESLQELADYKMWSFTPSELEQLFNTTCKAGGVEKLEQLSSQTHLEQYAGYIIIEKGEHSCIGVNHKAPEKYVFWLYDNNKQGVNSGVYSNNYNVVLENFKEIEGIE